MAGTAIYHPITKEHKQQQMNDLTIQNSSETESDKTLGPHFCPDLQHSTSSSWSVGSSAWGGSLF